MTDEDDRRSVGSIHTEVVLAVELVDAYTGGRPVSPASVSLADEGDPFRRGPSGYYVLRDRPDAPDQLEIVVDAPGYLPATASMHRDDLNVLHPVVSVSLLPAPHYDFGAGETLVRGRVEGDADDTSVSIEGRDEKTFCDERGEFVLWFETIEADDVKTTAEGRRFLEIDGGDPRVRAERPDGTIATEAVELEVGSTAAVTISF